MKEYADIKAFIADFPVEIQAILEKIRATIQLAAPEAKEAIKYSIPTFDLITKVVKFRVEESLKKRKKKN